MSSPLNLAGTFKLGSLDLAYCLEDQWVHAKEWCPRHIVQGGKEQSSGTSLYSFNRYRFNYGEAPFIDQGPTSHPANRVTNGLTNRMTNRLRLCLATWRTPHKLMAIRATVGKPAIEPRAAFRAHPTLHIFFLNLTGMQALDLCRNFS